MRIQIAVRKIGVGKSAVVVAIATELGEADFCPECSVRAWHDQ